MKNPRRAGDLYEKYLKGPLASANLFVYEGPLDKFNEVFEKVSGSGSTAYHKGDLKSEHYLMQAKRTDKKSFTIKLADLQKAEKEAMNIEKKPIFIIGFYSSDRPTDEWVLMPKWAI